VQSSLYLHLGLLSCLTCILRDYFLIDLLLFLWTIMSSPPIAGGDRRDGSPQVGPGGTWHPARAWLEEDATGDDEDDMDYEPDSDDHDDRTNEEEYPEDEPNVDQFGIANQSHLFSASLMLI
jgi:hypothetical protein